MRAILSILALLLAAGDGAAQPEFFARKTVTVIIGYTAGGSYDLYGRMIARHLGKHIPGTPTVIVQNMPGAGSLKAANYLYEVAPKDGTALGVIVESAALEQALANPAVQYDAAKFTYLGRVATSNNIFMQWHTAKVQSLDDARRMETRSPAPARPIAENVRGCSMPSPAPVPLVSGYPPRAQPLAMERGEVDGASVVVGGGEGRKARLAAERKIRIILQTTPERTAERCRRRRASARSGTRPRTSRCSRSTPAAVRSTLMLAPPDRRRACSGIAQRVSGDGRRSRIRRRPAAHRVELSPLPGEQVREPSPVR